MQNYELSTYENWSLAAKIVTSGSYALGALGAVVRNGIEKIYSLGDANQPTHSESQTNGEVVSMITLAAGAVGMFAVTPAVLSIVIDGFIERGDPFVALKAGYQSFRYDSIDLK